MAEVDDNARKDLLGELVELRRQVAELQKVQHEYWQAEQELRENQRMLSTLLSNLPGMAYRCRNDRDWTMEFVSQGCLSLTGYDPEYLIDNAGLSYNDLIHPEDRAHVREAVQAGLAADAPFRIVYRIIATNGMVKWVWEQGRGVLASDGTLIAIEGFITDVTEHKNAVEALRSSEERYRRLMTMSSEGVYSYGFSPPVPVDIPEREQAELILRNGTVTECNDSLARIHGYSEADAMLGFHLDDMMAGTREERIEAVIRFIRDGYRISNFETRGRDRHGNELWTVNSLFGLVEDGFLVWGWASLSDISAPKKAEEALKRANILLFTQKETSIDGILAVGEDNTIISSNRRFAEMWGISPEMVEGRSDDAVLRSVLGKVCDPEAFFQRVAHLYAHRDETGLEEVVLKDGRTFERYSAPMNGADGSYHGRVWYFRDISERKRMEEALARAEAKYRGIFENALMGIFQSNPEGGFLRLNRALAGILGYDSPEDVLSTVTDISRQLCVNPERHLELLRLVEEREMLEDFEVQFFKKDRSTAWVTLNIRAVRDENGGIIFLEGTAQDVTEKKSLRAQLTQAQKLEALGTLAGGIAHDFNNILTPIIGYSELALREIPSDTPLYRNLEQVLRSGNRAKDLVRQILTFSRKAEQRRGPVRVSILINETIQMLRSMLPSTIDIRHDIDSEVNYSSVMGDPTQIHQVLMNLCTNAAHAMREKGGVLTIALAKVDIDSTTGAEIPGLEDGPYLRLSVSDTGHGMDEEARQRIFDPYFTTKGPDEGTGLGLSVVYGIVQGLSGAITVASNPGQGATFHVFFPTTETSAATSAPSPRRPPTGNGRILVVDDEKYVGEMLTEMLEKLGYEVVARYSSSGALEVFQEQSERFDLVITDQTMPHMTGTDLAKEMLGIRPDIPIILCTGFSSVVDEATAREIGIKAFLMKPVALQKLAEEIHGLLNRE